MPSRQINSDKPHLWKADIAASVDLFNQWFMDFAPAAFRDTRVITTERVKAALIATNNLRDLNSGMLQNHPDALATLRMCTAPPLAVDRLIGLASASKSLVSAMERGKLATRMKPDVLVENLDSICRVLTQMLDRDIFPWLAEKKKVKPSEVARAATIVADRLCSAVSNPIIRNAQEQRQLTLIGDILTRADIESSPTPRIDL